MEKMLTRRLIAAFLASFGICAPLQAQEERSEPVIQLCTEFSGSGNLLQASVSAHRLNIRIGRPDGRTVELAKDLGDSVPVSNERGGAPIPGSPPIRCQLAASPSSKSAALAMLVKDGTLIALLDLTASKITHLIGVPAAFPIQFDLHPIGYVKDSETLALSQAHYLPTGEPEIKTLLINVDGRISPVPHSVLGPQDAEVTYSSFDFRDARVWFLCPAYSARLDRQPRCTLRSVSLLEADGPTRDIPPPPDDRVVGSGQPNLGFPSSNLAVILAERRFWLYNFADRSFHQLNLPETPHHIRWFEFPGVPKFTSDERFAALPVNMYHFPLFVEGQVPHGTKLLIVELRSLQIVETIQPVDKAELVDFAVHCDGKILTVVGNWAGKWHNFQFPTGESTEERTFQDRRSTTPQHNLRLK